MPINESGEKVFQIKVSTVRTLGLVAAGILVAVGIGVLAIHFTTPKTVTFRASVDGVDVVKISGSRLWIEHQDFQLPVWMKVNGAKWDPIWNDSVSTPYTLRRAFRPGNPKNIKLVKHRGRGDITILEMPSAANNQTLSIKLDDGAYGGADYYEFIVSW